MILAEVHNAKKVTFDGRDHWIGSLSFGGRLVDVSGPDVSTKEEAIAWCKREAHRRGYGKDVRVDVQR